MSKTDALNNGDRMLFDSDIEIKVKIKQKDSNGEIKKEEEVNIDDRH